VKTEEPEDDVARLVCHLAEWTAQSSIMFNEGVSEADLQQFRDALNKVIDERIMASSLAVTPPKWRKGQQVIKVGKHWTGAVAPADRNVYVVTRDSWADSPTWVEPRETAKI
jgi:hypothetical protein